MNKKGPNSSIGDSRQLSSPELNKPSQKYQEKNFDEAAYLFRSLFENHPDAVFSLTLNVNFRMITSFLSPLQKKYNDKLDDKARQNIHFANDGAVRMRQIILDLLEYSRIVGL